MRLAGGVRTPDELRARFDALSALLAARWDLWTARPFVHRRPSWARAHPEVAGWLRALPLERLTAIDQAPHAPPADAPPAFRAWAEEAAALTRIPDLAGPGLAALERERLGTRVPARKWAQVRAFVAAAAPRLPPDLERAVDWCAGKGHLGRAVHLAAGLPVRALERRADLCRQAEHLAGFFGVAPYHAEALDVLVGGRAHLGSGAVGVGLHACGILWRTLLADAAQAGAAAAVAPCCYHNLGGEEVYRPLSARGRATGLEFLQPHLRLAVAEERVARPAIRRARRREQAWRLGLDLLLREASGVDAYVPQGVFPKAWIDLDFADFCRTAAEAIGRDLPPRFDPEAAQAAGEARAQEVYALAQVRSLYRRPLELWLVLDAAMRELEAGREVELGTFCDPDLTPRNLLMITRPA